MTTTMTDWAALAEELGAAFEVGADERDAGDVFVADHYDALKARGVIAALVPADLGGGGASHSEVAHLLRILATHDPSTALALSMHQHLVAAQVFNHLHGRPAAILARVASEQAVLVSTGARDWLESNGTMRQVDGGFRVTAQKAFASGSPAGDFLVTSARFEDPAAGAQVLHFAASLHQEGVTIGSDWRAHGMRATGSQTVALDDVFVPDASITIRRSQGAWHDAFNMIVGVAAPLYMAPYVGTAERAARIATSMPVGGGRSAETQWAIGEMRSNLVVARVCWERMVALTDDFRFQPSLEVTDEMLILKTRVVEATLATVEHAMEATGGKGFFRRTGIEQLLRDVRAAHYHPLPAKEQLRFTGRVALGLEPVEAPAHA